MSRYIGDNLNTIFNGCDPWSLQVILKSLSILNIIRDSVIS